MIGCRPMTRVTDAFIDVVTGNIVSYYVDCDLRYWLADNRWGWFRIPVNLDMLIEALATNEQQPKAPSK
jgi:hypothetical protein